MLRDKVQDVGVLPEHARDHVSEILQEVEAVGDLSGVRSRPPRRFGVLSATVPAHHLHTRVLPEPPGERVRASVGQNVHQHATLEIHQDRPVASTPAESEVVHAQDPRCFVILELQRTDMVEQSVPGDDDPEIPQETGACFTPEGKGDVPEPAVQTLGPASVVGGKARQTLREDRATAEPLIAEEPSDAQANGDRHLLPGQISERPRVAGMDPGGSLPAHRAQSHAG